MIHVPSEPQRTLFGLKEALKDNRAELRKAQSGIEAIDSASVLELVANSLEQMVRAVENGPLPRRSERSFGLWRIVIDTWPPDSKLRHKIVEAELLFDRL